MCLYNYAVDQQFGSHGSAEQNLSFSAAVEIGCHSGTVVTVYDCHNYRYQHTILITCHYIILPAVGVFNETSAIQFCMTVTDISVEGFAFNRTTNKDME